MKNVLVWFRNDLRLRDNYVLHHETLKRADCMLGLYFFDNRFENKFTKPFREEGMRELCHTFKNAFGVPLLCFNGRAELIIPKITELLDGGGHILCSEEVTSYELRQEKKIQAAMDIQCKDASDESKKWKLESVWNYSMYHPEDLKGVMNVHAGELPGQFTRARQLIEKNRIPVRKPLPCPTLAKSIKSPMNWGSLMFLPEYIGEMKAGEIAPTTPYSSKGLHFPGGESKALQRLIHYCGAKGTKSPPLATYKKTRNGSLGWDYSTKLSPFLAAGFISPRQIHHAVRDYEAKTRSTQDTYWVIFELIWRDYMRFFGLKHGNSIFFEDGPAEKLPSGVTWYKAETEDLADKLEAWKTGTTGIPWVDGHMRELLHTGFMSNRGRQNVASFLIFELKLDWRLGAKHFEEYLIDHDVTQNWCNWNAAAGVAGGRINRFNVDKQARDYDPKGEHARHWIPELPEVLKGSSVHDLAYGGSRAGQVKTSLDKWLKPKKTGVVSDTKTDSPTGIKYAAPIIKVSKFVKRDSKSKDAEKRRKKGYKKARFEKRVHHA